MKAKIAKNAAKIIVARMINTELLSSRNSSTGFYSDCSECNEMVGVELKKLSDRLLGSFNDMPHGANELLEALGAIESIEAGKRQGRLEF